MPICLIVVDSLSYEYAPDLAGFRKSLCYSLADNTEPSLATILTGLAPSEHKITTTGAPDNRQKLERVADRMLTRFCRSSFIASPAVIFHKYFTRSAVCKYVEELACSTLGGEEFILLHFMDVHDYRDVGRATKYYKGFAEIPDNVLDWVAPSGLPRVQESLIQLTRDANLLRAKYLGAVERSFEILQDIIRQLSGYEIIITADHGEDLDYFHHHGRNTTRVPLYTRFEHEIKNHIDLYKFMRDYLA